MKRLLTIPLELMDMVALGKHAPGSGGGIIQAPIGQILDGGGDPQPGDTDPDYHDPGPGPMGGATPGGNELPSGPGPSANPNGGIGAGMPPNSGFNDVNPGAGAEPQPFGNLGPLGDNGVNGNGLTNGTPAGKSAFGNEFNLYDYFGSGFGQSASFDAVMAATAPGASWSYQPAFTNDFSGWLNQQIMSDNTALGSLFLTITPNGSGFGLSYVSFDPEIGLGPDFSLGIDSNGLSSISVGVGYGLTGVASIKGGFIFNAEGIGIYGGGTFLGGNYTGTLPGLIPPGTNSFLDK